MEKAYTLLDALVKNPYYFTSPQLESDLFPSSLDKKLYEVYHEDAIWINAWRPYTFKIYAENIIFIMTRYLNPVLYPIQFVEWCDVMIHKSREHASPMMNEIQAFISEILTLPKVKHLLNDDTFYTKLMVFLEIPGEYRNEEIVNTLYYQIKNYKIRTYFRDQIKEELIASAMHPMRIERLVDMYGIDVLESI